MYTYPSGFHDEHTSKSNAGFGVYFLQGGGRRPQVRFHVEEPTAAAAHGCPRPKRLAGPLTAPQLPKRSYIVEEPATDAENIGVKAIQIILECILMNVSFFIGVGRLRRR